MKLYLDINQFGTPHWLGELARIDPTTIRAYNRQQWINAMKAKGEAAQAARKIRVMNDAGFDPSQDRDEHGRWTRTGQTKLGAKADWIRTKVDAVADELHFPKDRIFLSDEKITFQLNGETMLYGGAAVGTKGDGWTTPGGVKYGTGDVVVFGTQGFDKDFPVAGIIAHEIQHQRWNQVQQRFEEELKQIDDRYKRTATDGDGNLLPQYREEFPTVAAMQDSGWHDIETGKILTKTDGVTEYSKRWWKEHADGKAYYSTAVNETLAEIAALEQQGDLRRSTNDVTFDDVEKFVIADITNDPNYTEEEQRRVNQDPWEYADAVNRDRFYKRFGVRFDEVGFDVQKRTVEMPDFSESSFYVVIAPEWEKLYETVKAQYKRINMIKDAGFDEDQPRDEEGQWTSGGPVKLKLGGKMRTLSRNDWASTKATLDLFKGAYLNPINDQEIVWAWEQDGKDGQLLAFMEFGPAHDEDTMYLKHIRTFPQREGAGRMAMEKVMKYAGEKGMGIYLDVARNSSTPYRALRKFYTGLGFKGKGDSLIWRP